MDGTLVDTEPYWIATETELVEAHGGTWSHEQALDLVGNELIVSATMLRDGSGIDLEPEDIVGAAAGQGGRPGADASPAR